MQVTKPTQDHHGDWVLPNDQFSNICNQEEHAIENAYKVLELDCPYELYWGSLPSSNISTTCMTYHVIDNGIDFCHFQAPIVLSLYFTAHYGYAAIDAYNSYDSFRVDTSKTQVASQTVARAKDVVNQYASLSDYEKLIAYKDWICNHVDYDYDAVEHPWTPYRDYWELVYVFDNDPTTNVVCVGYAKAFQYLCDLSTFQNASTKCYTVEGYLDNNGHEWNTVTLQNDNEVANYIVDVTNVDGGWPLFLTGATNGNIRDGYTFVSDLGAIKFTYANEYTDRCPYVFDLYGTDDSSILNLSLKDFSLLTSPEQPSQPDSDQSSNDSNNYPILEPNKPNNPSIPDNPTPTFKTGWQNSGSNWYFYNNSGIKLTGWQKIGDTWYHFNSDGAMATGWTQIGGAWYYLTPSGAMATGWRRIGGTWYYLKPSGAMATGWQQIGGIWYYLNGSGAMQTGWYKVGPKWYYSNASGAMQASRWIGNYYVGSSGAMATSQWVGPYYVDASGLWVR